ncbi:MAG: hypothetical protein LBU45_08440, partial [Azoarcus sp.]|nr:hypothetical protein [Azoarcus sp.]
MHIQAGALHNSGTLKSDYLALSAAQDLTHTGRIESGQWLFLHAGRDLKLDGTDRARGTLTSGTDTLSGDMVIQAGRDVRIDRSDLLSAAPKTAPEAADNRIGGTGRVILTAGSDATLTDRARVEAQTDLIGTAGGVLTLQPNGQVLAA